MPELKLIAKVNNHAQFKVSRTKLARALQLLEKPVNNKDSTAMNLKCSEHILNQVLFKPHCSRTSKKQRWQELFRTVVTRHEWDTFVRALRLSSQWLTFGGLQLLLRNTFFGILTHPMYRDPQTLRLFLYAMSPCRNEKDIEFCIQTILQAFNGEQTTVAKKKIDKPVIRSTEEVKQDEEQNNLDLE
ncbi:uncharacterized protein LOC131258799 [Anopheles coustani]|uniref:uncharacterized protein LOC131258799 n=1 Tax=Anopheles coustani TaxID=139045 RepID=UPI00265A97EF|nr:uncharacterized protein LOC131258799 [Anopheles coustani]